MLVERARHLVAVEVRRFGRLLRRHPEFEHVQEELQQVLVLRVAALHREREPRLAVLHREARRQRDARPLAGFEHVERILGRVEHERLHALAEPDAGAAGDRRRDPAAARRHRDQPAFRVGRDHAGGAALERFLELLEIGGSQRVRLAAGRVRATILLQQVEIGILPALERIRIAGPGGRVVAIAADRRRALLRVFLREQPAPRLVRREVRVAVVEVAIGEREVHRLVHRVDVARAVVAHRLQVEVLEQVERLQQRRSLRPGVELVDLDASIAGVQRLLDQRLPLREVGFGDEAALFLHAADEFARDVALVEAVVRGLDRVLARLAGGERLLLGLDQLAQRVGEVLLAEDLARLRRFACLAEVRQHHLLRIGPFLQLVAPALDRVRGFGFDRIAVRELDGGRQHLGQRQPAVFGEHQHQAAGRARRHGRERSVRGRIGVTLAAIELRRRPGRRDAEAVDRDHLLRMRIVDERLRLAAPAQRVPHRRGGRDHRAGGVHGVAAALEHHRAGGRGQRLAGDRHPLLPVQRRLLRLRHRLRDARRHGLAERVRGDARHCGEPEDEPGEERDRAHARCSRIIPPPAAPAPSAGRRRGRTCPISSTRILSRWCGCRRSTCRRASGETFPARLSR